MPQLLNWFVPICQIFKNLAEIDAAIRQVAVSNGYTMIFDTSKGQLLYAVESQDVMEQVKASL